MSTRDALADYLLADTFVTSQIDTFRGKPNVFARDPVPPSVEGRYIVVGPAISDVAGSFDNKDHRGRLVLHDILFLEDETGDPAPLDALAVYVRDKFDRYPVLVSGYGASLITKVSGPILVPTDDQVSGRLVTVSLDLAKE